MGERKKKINLSSAGSCCKKGGGRFFEGEINSKMKQPN